MASISFRVSKDEERLIKDYVKVNNLNLSETLRNLILDEIEDDLKLDEERILEAQNRIGKEKAYDHTEVWEKLGV
ncbi:antitoxin [Anaerococcus sp. AGMB00486]|uniref:Antitoxin n=2 Tax=Anaerococcus TaxID=165779 RepID=A0ABX2N850_9FIRM|nr:MULTISPECIES: DUF6290 family protein [Anaerococcus]MSS77371.1 antitoxin [Anaerococcus porci]NVF10828.1 antitoxin [Anaerococcus faecalis]